MRKIQEKHKHEQSTTTNNHEGEVKRVNLLPQGGLREGHLGLLTQDQQPKGLGLAWRGI